MIGPKLTIIPITFERACAFCDAFHRHHRRPVGYKFAIGVIDETETLRGIALCGRPIARGLDDGLTIEVNRTATDGCQNANSALYGACWRIATAMGYRRIVTYTQEGETGASLKAANFQLVRDLPARGSWAQSSKILRHIRDPIGAGNIGRKLWQKELEL